MNREKLAQMERAIAADYGNIAGMTVLRDGGTVYESYFGDCTDKSHIHVFSVTKSVVSILFGIALDRGYLDGGIWDGRRGPSGTGHLLIRRFKYCIRI